ncbi:MAG: hypothetical protein PWP27_2546 [Clostridiales bacterium]|nr:hypothetical protein [Clostridiales bacterium]
MIPKDARQVVIIKDIKSNIIEEAILVLKNNIDMGRDKKKLITANKYDPTDSDHIIKEAQNIIDNYIKQYTSVYNYYTTSSNSKKTSVHKFKKHNLSVGMILNIALFISIALFILLLSRAI